MHQSFIKIDFNEVLFLAITNMLSSSIDLVKSQEEMKEVKFSWRIKNFTEKISMCSDTGLNSKQMKIKINNFTTTWNASLRYVKCLRKMQLIH